MNYLCLCIAVCILSKGKKNFETDSLNNLPYFSRLPDVIP